MLMATARKIAAMKMPTATLPFLSSVGKSTPGVHQSMMRYDRNISTTPRLAYTKLSAIRRHSMRALLKVASGVRRHAALHRVTRRRHWREGHILLARLRPAPERRTRPCFEGTKAVARSGFNSERRMVPEEGIEPTRALSPPDFESGASASFTTPARS